MKTRFLAIILLLISSFSVINAQKIYYLSEGIDEAKRYFAENILELDQVEGLYKIHLDIQIHNVLTGIRNSYYDYYIVIVDPKKVENRDWPFVMALFENGELKPYGEIRKNGNTYTVTESDNFNRLVTAKFQMISSSNFSYSRSEGDEYTTSRRLVTANKIYPTSEMYQAAIYKEQSKKAASSGTGFLINDKGYILTNYHVIENAQNGNIKVIGINDDYNTIFWPSVEIVDKQNDLAILKIPPYDDSSETYLFKFNTSTFGEYLCIPINVPYTFKFNTASVGEDCFVLGYPLISSMGQDIKLTNGIISSKTGFDGNVAQYQISAPVQPGNSGGPLFDKDGNVIGIVQAKHTQAENAGYAIKSSYIRNLVELLPYTITLPQNNQLKGKTLPQQVELASKAVCTIIINDNNW